jgi:hypothetical protein
MSEGKPDDLSAKAEKLATDALEAGKKFAATDTGKKVADATDTAFQTAEEMARKVADSELGKKALDSEIGKQATQLARDANEAAKAKITNPLARNMAIGAAAGAVVALPLPFIGPFLGAIVGGGIGYLRTVTKKD